MQAAHLKPLTSLRFFAAIWVVLYSYWPAMSVAAPGLVAKGYLGVEVFFVLSGFILCHVYLPQAEASRFRYRSFLWARIARVYPLHLVTLIAIGLMAAAAILAGFEISKDVLAWDALPANLLMVHAWGLAKTAGWNHPSWSISAEWFAYLAFPAFAWTAIRLRSRPFLAVGGGVAALFALYVAFDRIAGFPLTEATFAWGALRIVPCFALGCAVYLLWRSGVVNGRNLALAGAAVSLAVLGLSAQFGAPDGVPVAAGAMLILFLASCVQHSSRIGSSPAFVYLGEVSYAVYMVAIPWQLLYVNAASRILGFEKGHMPIYAWIVFVVTVVPVAAVAHHLVERPARDLLRKGWKSRAFVSAEAEAI